MEDQVNAQVTKSAYGEVCSIVPTKICYNISEIKAFINTNSSNENKLSIHS